MSGVPLNKTGKQLFRLLQIPFGRLRYIIGWCRFRGAFKSREKAIAAIPSHLCTGYDNDVVVDISYNAMCRIMPWDYPVIYWLHRLLPQSNLLLDAGGHMGTKYRAFREYLDVSKIQWIIYDVPAIVRAGKQRALEDGLMDLKFIDTLDGHPCPDIFLASGLLQYLDISFSELIGRLPAMPRHLLINKVAMRDGETIVTLENFGEALVPYQIRNRKSFLSEMRELGYCIQDEWKIPSLSGSITTHPELGNYQSAGFYMTQA